VQPPVELGPYLVMVSVFAALCAALKFCAYLDLWNSPLRGAESRRPHLKFGPAPPKTFSNHFRKYILLDYSRHTMDLNILNVDSHTIVVNIAEYTLRMTFHEVFEAIIL
jgi:hypothetical protein